MKWKIISYSSLVISIVSFILFVKNAFFWDGVATFMEKVTGLYEPYGTFILLSLFVFSTGSYLYFGRAVPIKKIVIGTIIGIVIVALIPLALILIHAGEL